jgi:hypothetical protein
VRRLLWKGETEASPRPLNRLHHPGQWFVRGSDSNCNPHSGPRRQAQIFAVLVGQRVLDTHLVVEMIRPVDGDLCFFRFLGWADFMIFRLERFWLLWA